jgi:hypothetical protein
MTETANAIHQLAERARGHEMPAADGGLRALAGHRTETAPEVIPRLGGTVHMPEPVPPDPVYDFEHLGTRIAESLVIAAEAQVAEANTLLDQTKALAESIREQVKIQTEALASLNGRLKTFGGDLLDAHKKFNGGK